MRWLILAVGFELFLVACTDQSAGGSHDTASEVPDAASGCVPAGSGTLLHDNVADFTLTSCSGETFRLHDRCGGDTKAFWFVATTGWCTGCIEFLRDYVAAHGGSLSRANVGAQDPGLELMLVLGEDPAGDKPSPEYCLAWAEELHIDPAMVVLDWSDPPVEIALRPGGELVPTSALANVWSHMTPYFADSTSAAYPWWALLRARNMEYVWTNQAPEQSFESARDALLAE